MAPINGRAMLERVTEALIESGSCKRIYVCIDDDNVLRTNRKLSEWLDKGLITSIPAGGNLADSVLAAAIYMRDEDWPVLITTGDNALHTPEFIREFADAARKTGADVALGITREETVIATIPEAGKAFHRVKDGGFSSCNVYALTGKETLKTVNVFRGGGQFGKKHYRILKAFGLASYLLYKFKLIGIDGIVKRLGKGFGVSVAPVILPYDFGPIDVDDQTSYDLAERILVESEGVRGKKTVTSHKL
jgi:GTP:adenosylcobinamide-phosphate guanylyltransferase